ncbi:hypothetical protein C9374_004876 [Naegleria lovaniensis]|uniref:AP-1 complex subunit gamma n=1 Tax=Naegleria lovaniensis TaxID=51637 RepID=A0AA88KIK2_NAELO|nr:uncharacterized protein C9374_004876 [Naegleria lovaniensis]KAG2382909.1 hypothetical protein C9374_004876 [Naegleria lovaniensis]
MSTRLRELIREVRNCKTAAEERSVIAKECAAIRTALKEQHPYRARNAAKLMYIHMLGYPTNFGQIECVNLISSSKYPEKRIGYLSLMILLDENQEVLTLTEHRFKVDLNDNNQFVQALALTAIGNIASADICRDLSVEVEKLLIGSPSFIRKKAAQCAVRIVTKCPDLIENYIEKIDIILENEQHQRSHSAMLGIITLILAILAPTKGGNNEVKDRRSYLLHFRKHVPVFVRLLNALLNSNSTSEYDVNGVADPFLQAKLLRLLRVLGKGSAKASEQMTEVLTKTITNTDKSKNTGNAVIYECVKTIMDIDCDQTLRNMAISQLGSFLGNKKDNNLRYVALHTMKKVSTLDSQAVSRQLATVVECLKDHDISIRKRALDLVYVIVDSSNVVYLVQELIQHLEVSPPEFKPELTTKLCTIIEAHAPSKEWKISTLLQVIILSAQFVRDEIASIFIGMLTQSPESQMEITKKLFEVLKELIPKPNILLKQEILMQVASWCLGEYGDLIIDSETTDSDIVNLLFSLMSILPRGSVSNVKGRRVLATDPNNVIRAYVLTALLKLTKSFPSKKAEIEQFVAKYTDSVHLDLQQRACELLKISTLGDSIKENVLDKMPEFQIDSIIGQLSKEAEEKEDTEGKEEEGEHQQQPVVGRGISELLIDIQNGSSQPATKESKLIDFFAPSHENSTVTTTTTTTPSVNTKKIDSTTTTPPKSSTASENILDMFSSTTSNTNNSSVSSTLLLFGETTTPSTATHTKPTTPSDSHLLLDDVLSAPTLPLEALVPQKEKKVVQVYNKNNFNVRFEFKELEPNTLNVIAYFSNNNSKEAMGLDFKVAAPKYAEVTLFKATATSVLPNTTDSVTQKFKIKVVGQKPITDNQIPVKYKLICKIGDKVLDETGTVKL